MFTQLLGDVRFGLRQLRRAPGYALTIGLTVALAIGAVTALLGVLQATLWSRLPYPDADRLYLLSDHGLSDAPGDKRLISVARFEDAQGLQRDGKTVFASAGHFYLNPAAVGIAGQEPRPVQEAGVSDNFFSTLGSPALLGRTLGREDNLQGAPLRLVISYGLWQSLFAADPHIVGRVVRVGNVPGTVVGVMGGQFAMPFGVDVWVPGHIQYANFFGYRGEGSRFLNAVVRLQPGTTLAGASAGLATLASLLAQRYPTSDAAYAFETESLRNSLFGSYRRALLFIVVSVALLVFAVVLNVCALQLTRSIARVPEFAMRSALGVTEGRLFRQLATENLVLLGIPCIAGLQLGQIFCVCC